MTLFVKVLFVLACVVLYVETSSIDQEAEDKINDAQSMLLDSTNLDAISNVGEAVHTDGLNLDELNKGISEASDKTSESLDQQGRDANVALDNLDELNKGISEAGDKASESLDQLGRDANAALDSFGEEASKTLDKLSDDASKKLDSALSGFEGTMSDVSRHATKKGEESVDRAQQWFEDKLVFYLHQLTI